MSLAHPPKNQLIAFGQGKLAPDESQSIETHLEGCPECCETLLDLQDDTFTGLVRQAQQINVTAKNRLSQSAPDQILEVHSADASPQDLTLVTESSDSESRGELPTELREHPRYRIIELVGQGGMGCVYRAEHRLMNRTVAVKLVNSQLVRNPQAVERFRREVRAAARLLHPNIVTAHDAEQAGDAHFLVMEFVDGIDLATIVKDRGPMSIAEACRCVRQAADGLQHAHEQGMVHRDIKPHNLMLSAAGQVRILDFGLAGFATESALGVNARQNADEPAMATEAADLAAAPEDRGYAAAAAHLTAMGSVMGTPDYIAPEQAADAHAADIRADIYSLGCTLHFLLTGKPPFEADNVLAKLKAHAEHSPPALTALRNDVPSELANIVLRMMAKNPSERFQTPAEVAAALAPLALTSSSTRKPQWGIIAVALAGAAFLLAGLIVILTDKGRLEIRSERDDVDFVIMQNGQVFRTIDLQTGSQVTWLPSGDYDIALKQGNSFINLDQKGFRLLRWGKEIVHVTRKERALTEAPAADRDRLQGEWLAESGERNGQPIPIDQITMQRVVFEGDTMRVELPAAMKGSGQFQLIESSEPKEIRLQPQVPPPGVQRNDLLRGIYKLEGDQLTLCMDRDRSALPPTSFAAPAGTTLDLIVLRQISRPLTLSAEFLEEYDLVVRLGRGLLRDEERQKLVADRPYIAEAMSEEMTRGPIEMFSGLPDSAHAELKRIGYVKWRFADVPASHQQVYRRQFKWWVQKGKWSPEMINDSEVGFAVVRLLKSTVVTAFVLYPNDTSEMWSTVVGTLPYADNDSDAAHPPQLKALRNKPLTTLPDSFRGPLPAKPVSDHDRLQGKWVPVSASFRGKALAEQQLARLSIRLDGNRAELTDPDSGQTMTGTFTVDASRSPKHIDLIAPDGKERAPGIFEFDGERLKLATIDGDYARPTDFSPSDQPDHMTGVFERAPLTGPALGVTEREVVKAAEAYLAVMDEGRFGQLRDMGAAFVKRRETREQYSQKFQKIRDTLGKAIHRTLDWVRLLDDPAGMPKGRYANVQYQSNFERVQKTWEVVSLVLESDGQWRVAGYAHTLEPLPFPEPKDEPQPGPNTPTRPSAAPTPPPRIPLGAKGHHQR